MPPTLAILAGGESSRMRTPKAALRIAGTPILQFILDRLNWPGETLVVTAPGHEHPPACERFSREITDPFPGAGPLRALLTTLEHTQDASAIVVTTCDMPLVTREMLTYLTHALDSETTLAMTQTAERIEPFPIALQPNAYDALKHQFDLDNRSIQNLVHLPKTKLVQAPPAWPKSVWTNLNSPEDFQRFIADQSSPP